MLKIATWVKYLPALFFFGLWVQFIIVQLAVERAILTSPIGSRAMESGLDWAMEKPWQQYGAGVLYFGRLSKERVPAEVWLKSDVYAQAIWAQGQWPGSLEVLIKIAALKNNQYEIDRLTRLYLSAYPHHPFANTIRGYLRSSQAHRP